MKSKENNEKIIKGKLKLISTEERFKKIFINNSNLENLTFLLSRLLKISYDDLLGKIELLETPLSNTNLGEIQLKREVLVSFTETFENILLEVIIKKDFYEQNVIKFKGDYQDDFIEKKIFKEIDYSFSFKFSKELLFENLVFEEFFYRNENGDILTKKYKSLTINLNKCYSLWLNGDYQKQFLEYDKDLILISALLKTVLSDEYLCILSSINMPIELKNSIKDLYE